MPHARSRPAAPNSSRARRSRRGSSSCGRRRCRRCPVWRCGHSPDPQPWGHLGAARRSRPGFNAALPRVVGYQAGEVAREPGGVLQPLVQGSIGRVPVSSKDRLQGQLWERTYRRCQQQGIEEFLLGVASAGKAVLVDGLTEVLESVKLFHGEHLVGWPYQFLPWGGHAQDADRLFCSPTLV